MPAVAEGRVGPLKINNDVQRVPHEGVEGRKEVKGDGVRPVIEAPGGPRSDVAQGFLANRE